jgi:CubicO group peptidase (beta-lactamase class C family)
MLAPLLLVLAAVAPVPPAGAPPSDAALAARLVTRLEALAADRRFSGELRISRGGQLIVQRGFGGVTVTPGQPGVYAAGSITKTFTAAGVLLLAQQGRLGLDDPLSRYFPEVDPGRLTREGRAVTLDDLLTHTSGLAGMFLWPHWAHERPPDAVARSLSEARLATTPGRAFVYCNECYVVLGEVIHRVSGVPYDRFIHDHIAGPLALVDTGMVPGPDQRRRLLPGQVRSLLGLHPSQRLMPHRLRRSYEWPGGADGSLRSTTADLARFFGALAGGKLLDPAMRDRMFTEKLQRYGRGIAISPLGQGARLLWHNGALSPLGYEAFAGIVQGAAGEDPPLLVVALANVDHAELDLTSEVGAALKGATPPPPPGRWTFGRVMNTLRALHLGPAMATLAVAALLWRRRRPAGARGRTLTAVSAVLALAAVGLGGATTPVFAGGMLVALIAGAAELRRPPSRGWNWDDPACVVALVTLLIALPMVTLVLVMRWLVS